MSNSNIAGVVHKCLLAEVNVYFKTFVFTEKNLTYCNQLLEYLKEYL